jgi:hypothetical protein
VLCLFVFGSLDLLFGYSKSTLALPWNTFSKGVGVFGHLGPISLGSIVNRTVNSCSPFYVKTNGRQYRNVGVDRI